MELIENTLQIYDETLLILNNNKGKDICLPIEEYKKIKNTFILPITNDIKDNIKEHAYFLDNPEEIIRYQLLLSTIQDIYPIIYKPQGVLEETIITKLYPWEKAITDIFEDQQTPEILAALHMEELLTLKSLEKNSQITIIDPNNKQK